MAGSPSVAGVTFAGRYAIEREIGRGATATVFLARDGQRGLGVAIKVLRDDVAQSVGAERFLREIRITQNLQHPHIVPVLDSGETEGQLYCVLPHMEEGSLRQLLQREKQLPVETAIAIARSVAEALDYAHARGLIHRDVKPENILFTSGQACLADFGIARAIERAIDESTTSTGLVRGTPAYMSPEQASGSTTYDGRSDIYSLALVFYEMLAGVPAFIAPTPEAVIAQRFLHSPRPLSVYRSQVPPALEAAVERALSLTAADRFQSASEFVRALEDAWRERDTAGARRRTGPGRLVTRRTAVFGATTLAVMMLGGTWAARQYGPWISFPSDTTRYALLPLQSSSAAPASVVYERLHSALSAWRGISLASRFEVDDAVGAADGPMTDRQASRAARRANARRYFRGSLSPVGDSLRVTVALFDLGTKQPLATASRHVARDLAAAGTSLDGLVTALLLRGDGHDGIRTRSVPAAQLFKRALAERKAFDLRATDSLLRRTLEYDSAFSEAALLLGQISLWRQEPGAPWQLWVERAAAQGSLGAHATLGSALLALARGDPAACHQLARLAREAERDFSLWYTVATCLTIDTIVVRDGSSRSGWRFRASYQEAVRAYTNAFLLAPTLHRRFQAGAYGDLRLLLFTARGQLRPGAAAAPDTGKFLAYAEWDRDSLLFIPYPRLAVIRGEVRTNVIARDSAARAQRRLFADIARAWSAALPDNASTKEALAISLDMLGDVSSLDSMRAARRLAMGTAQAFSLAVEETLLRISWGRTDPAHLTVGRRLGDSLLRTHPAPSAQQADPLARIAALLGRCSLAGSLAGKAQTAQDARAIGVDLATLAMAESLTVITAMGCRGQDTVASALVAGRIAASTGGMDPTEQFQVQWALLGRLARMSLQNDPALVRRFAAPSGDYLLDASISARRGESDRATTQLELRRRARGPSGTAEISPEVVLAEGLLWQYLAKPSLGREWLDPLLNRPSWLEPMLRSPTSAAALLRGAALRVELAAPDETSERRRWANVIDVIWAGADPPLRAYAQRLLKLSQ